MKLKEILAYPEGRREKAVADWILKNGSKGSDTLGKFRTELVNLGKILCQQNHSDEAYMEWLSANPITYKEQMPSYDRPFAFCLFSVASQHVYGNSFRECLDKAIEATGNPRRPKYIGTNKHGICMFR